MEEIGLLMRHHHENFDGSGYPDKMSGKTIPLGSRIIAVANSFDRYINSRGQRYNEKIEESIKVMQTMSKTMLDPIVVRKFIEFLMNTEPDNPLQNEKIVQVDQLRVGMVLSRDLYTASKLLLISKDEVLRISYIEKIRNFNAFDPIDGGIFIYTDESSEEAA